MKIANICKLNTIAIIYQPLMHRPIVEIILPANGTISDEDVFKHLDSGIKLLPMNHGDRKRLLVVAMELFLNIRRHGTHHKLAVLRIAQTSGSGYVISSINYADALEVSRLSGKHRTLLGVKDYRKNFRDKLQHKLIVPEPAGNLGLDICFRNSSASTLRVIPAAENLQLIHLSFSLYQNGKSAA